MTIRRTSSRVQTTVFARRSTLAAGLVRFTRIAGLSCPLPTGKSVSRDSTRKRISRGSAVFAWSSSGGLKVEDKMIEWFDDFKLGMLFIKGARSRSRRDDDQRFATRIRPQRCISTKRRAEKTAFKGSADRGGTPACHGDETAV